ncbi:hypothetical protein [Streptacidiphilus sp. EB129]|uniref:hypothetical protein n=1 Tax=Streptacidiphilus sp. EB129 TaxID=3156262 RepID=UPI0035170C65
MATDEAGQADSGRGQHGWGKSTFEDIYDQPDPRAYFTRLRPLRYQTPHHAQPVFRRLLDQRARLNAPGNSVKVVDLCCSYGINAALVNHNLTLEDLYARYTGPKTAGLSTPELIEADKEFYAVHRREQAVPFIGIDVAPRAVAYASAVGLLDGAFAENLETGPASAKLARAVAAAGLITITGGVGYIGPRTFDTVLSHTRSPAWVAAFTLRMVDYRPIADTLAARGLVTHTSPETYPQRRFTDDAEQQRAIARATATGHDPTGREANGYYHTLLHQSRPTTATGSRDRQP